MQQIVGVRLVGRDLGPWGDEARGEGADIGLVLAGHDEGQGALAPDAFGERVLRKGLAHDRDAAPVGVAVLAQAPVHPVRGTVGGLDRPVGVAPVDLHLPGERRLVALRHQALAHYVHQDERGLVLHVQIPPQLQRGLPFDLIGVASVHRGVAQNVSPPLTG